MKGYKVFKVGPKGGLKSFLATGKAKVKYRKDRYNGAPKWLSKNGYFLTFFPKKCQAKDFVRAEGIGKYQIWKVKCLKVFRYLPSKLQLSSIRRGNIGYESNSWPYGTQMAMRIKPIKKVKE